MAEKVILISIDGMRPDGFLQCNNTSIYEMMKRSSYTLEGRTMVPSDTLPCHMSMFHSVPPERHGITTNTYVPMDKPVIGLFEQIKKYRGRSAMYYGWEAIRDVSRPGTLKHAEFIWVGATEESDNMLTEAALEYIKTDEPDFVFLYMAKTDAAGHNHGWMSRIYLQCINDAIENVKRVLDAVGDQYTVIVTADHGGHDHMHGTELAEDMTIPMFFIGKNFEQGKELSQISILDIAPTIAKVMEIPKVEEWEGKSVI